jgi:hypothetical protein
MMISFFMKLCFIKFYFPQFLKIKRLFIYWIYSAILYFQLCAIWFPEISLIFQITFPIIFNAEIETVHFLIILLFILFLLNYLVSFIQIFFIPVSVIWKVIILLCKIVISKLHIKISFFDYKVDFLINFSFFDLLNDNFWDYF